MNAGWLWWAEVLGRLSAEIALPGLAAALAARYARSPVLARWIWQAALVAMGLSLGVAFTDLRPTLPSAWVSSSVDAGDPRHRVLTSTGEVDTDPRTPGELRASSSRDPRATSPSAPAVWPGAAWLIGTLILTVRLVGGRARLAARVRRSPRPASSDLQVGKIGSAIDADPPINDGVGASVARLGSRMGLSRVRVLRWPGLVGPMAFGVGRPTVAVPIDFTTRFDPVQREAQLAHELAHLAGRDPLWRWVADLVCALAWWHPGAWWARSRLRAASEEVADQAAALVPGGRAALAESLVAIGRRLVDSRPASPGLGIAGVEYRSSLARRVEALLETREPRTPTPARGAWRVQTAGGLLMLVAASLPGPGHGSGGMGSLWEAWMQAPARRPGSPANLAPPSPIARLSGRGDSPETLAAGSDPKSNSNRVVTLDVKFVEVAERGSADLGLDWLFGQSPTNNGSSLSVRVPTHVETTGDPKGPNVQTDVLLLEGQTATLTEPQYRALLQRLEGRGGATVIAAPRVSTWSGHQAQVAIQESRTLVTGVSTNQPAKPDRGGVNYLTEELKVGPVVDLTPIVDRDSIRLRVLASVTEFLGYDDPGPFIPVVVSTNAEPPLNAQLPLPRLRVRNLATTQEVAVRSGETVVLRGPMSTNSVRTADRVPVLADLPIIGTHFRRDGTHTIRSRLYVFVTPELESPR